MGSSMKQGDCAGYNSVLSSRASIGENCYLEVSFVHSKAKVGSNVVLSYIDIHEEEDYVSIIFKNMSEVEMNFSSEEIQERFVRGDKSRHETGSGLGLAIAKSFVVAQGGTFDIEIDGDLFKVIMTFKKINVSSENT